VFATSKMWMIPSIVSSLRKFWDALFKNRPCRALQLFKFVKVSVEAHDNL